MKRILPLVSLAFALLLTSCLKEQVIPGEVTLTHRITPNFSKIKVEDGFQVEIIKGNSYNVAVEAPDGFQDYIYTDVSNDGVLSITLDSKFNPADITHKRVLIYMPTLMSITAWGNSEVFTTGIFASSKFYIDADEGSYVETNVSTDEMNVVASRGSDVKLSGETFTLFANELSGGSRLLAFRLRTIQSGLNLWGGSEAQVTVVDKLKVKASEASTVKFAGNPSITETLSGGSQIINAN